MKTNRLKAPRQSDKDNDEILRGKYREAVKENKRLRRLLKNRLRDQIDPEIDTELPDKEEFKSISCPRCRGNDITILELRGIPYLFCNLEDCEYRGPMNEKANSED